MWSKHGKCLRLHDVLPSGLPIHMYLTPYKSDGFTVWTVGLFIGGSRRRANDWYIKAKYRSKITGDGSLEGLHFALNQLLEFAKRLPLNAELQVGWEDERRHWAYRWLLRYPNWKECEDCICYRNADHWEPINSAP